jgi:hypothetical protein
MKITKKFGTLLLLSIMTATMAHANTKQNVVSMGIETETISFTHVENMSTEQLQKEVERLSQRGEVSLELGMELMKRWSQA